MRMRNQDGTPPLNFILENSMSEEYISKRDAAKLLGVDVRTLERYAADGRLTKYIRLYRVYFKREDVERLAEPQPQERKDTEE